MIISLIEMLTSELGPKNEEEYRRWWQGLRTKWVSPVAGTHRSSLNRRRLSTFFKREDTMSVGRRFLPNVLLMLAVNASSFAQTSTTVSWEDHSAQNCPLRLTRVVELVESVKDGWANASFSDRIVVTNSYNKTVIAFLLQTNVASSYSPLVLATNQQDSYFSHDLEIAPGQSYVHHHEVGSGRFSQQLSPGQKPGQPSLTERFCSFNSPTGVLGEMWRKLTSKT
jgi:hypothetical protein